jgi:hypothetical protein
MVPPERKKGPVLKEDIRAAAIAVVLIVAGLLWWQVTTLADCRNQAHASVNDALFSECPQSSPYGGSLSAMLAPLFPAARAKQPAAGPDVRR